MNKIILLFGILLLVSFVNAESSMIVGESGGGSYKCYEQDYCSGDYSICNETTGECELNMSSFTGCLVQNCDGLCQDWHHDSFGGSYFEHGEYYKENKCWCERYTETEKGVSVEDSGWIEIKECVIDTEEEGKNSDNPYSIIGVGASIIIFGGIWWWWYRETKKYG